MSEDFEYQLEQELKERERHIQQNNSKTFVDPNDGTEYEWNQSMKAWVPKIDDDFIAKYQSNYGYFGDEDVTKDEDNQQTDGSIDSQSKTAHNIGMDEKSEPILSNNKLSDNKKQFVSKLLNKHKTEPQQNQWFEVSDDHNTKVYVSNLPLNTTEEEFLELMKKCGLIEKDETNEYKLKLYRDSNGELKGDGLCTYIKIESVELALNILDGYTFKDKTISVERAKFSIKGQYDPSLKPKRKKKDKQKEKKKIEKLFDWRPEKIVGERPKSEKTVIIKNMFDPKEFLLEPKLILEYRTDLREECTQKCGAIKRIDIYDCHPEGVASISFAEFESADHCIQLMNGRFFAGRRLTAHSWDGKTKYKMDETEEETEKRLKQWNDFLEKDEN